MGYGLAMSTAFTTLAEALERGEAVHFWREPRYDGLECLSATFRTHRYVPHTHETYAVAAVLDGCEAFNHRGARHYVPVGSLAVVCPDELHDGEPAGEGFVYRTLYPSVELMRSVAEEISGKPFSGTPGFAQSVVEDAQLAGELAWLHATLANPAKAVLERDTRVMAFFANLLRRHGGIDARPQLGGESPSIVRARDYLDAHFAEEVTLEDLAAVARLNRAHFVRCPGTEVRHENSDVYRPSQARGEAR